MNRSTKAVRDFILGRHPDAVDVVISEAAVDASLVREEVQVLHPVEETKAFLSRMRSGRISRMDVVAARGLVLSEVERERADDLARYARATILKGED